MAIIYPIFYMPSSMISMIIDQCNCTIKTSGDYIKHVYTSLFSIKNFTKRIILM